MSLVLHELCKLFPPPSEEEYGKLRDDIKANGLLMPITLHDGSIIDGRSRARACEELGIAVTTKEWDGQGSMVGYVISMNVHRRHLDASQRACIAVEAEPFFAEEAKKRLTKGGMKGAAKTKAKGKVKDEGPMPKLAEGLKLGDGQDGQHDVSISEPPAIAQAAGSAGVSTGYAKEAKAIKTADSATYEELKAGTIKLPEAKRKAAVKVADLPSRTKKAESKSKAFDPSRRWNVFLKHIKEELAENWPREFHQLFYSYAKEWVEEHIDK
jgi:hypothetical protein